MKSETQSEFFTNIAKAVTEKIDEDAPIRKAMQQTLLKSVGQRDMSVNECTLICHKMPYVEFSLDPRLVNLYGNKKMKDSAEGEEILTESSNWQEAYWQRESNEGYKKLCSDYDSSEIFRNNFPLQKHPKDISLREFVTNFTQKHWKYRPAKVFPNFVPCYRYIVHKGKPHYENWCKSQLLFKIVL